MASYMMRYKGKYRVLCELDMDTNDFPRNSDGKIDDDVGLYIPCKYNGKIYAYGREGKYMQLCAYIPSRTRGRNIKKQMDKDKVPYHHYDETDEEVSFLFPSTEIDIVAKLVGAKVSGANISPFSTRNLNKNKDIKIPEEDMGKYKNIVKTINKNNMYQIRIVTNNFLNNVLQRKERKKDKNFDWKADSKRMKLSRQLKEYIYMKGYWNNFISYFQKNIKELQKME